MTRALRRAKPARSDRGSRTRRALPYTTVAAVDLGSNSFHMIVARSDNGTLHVLDRLQEMVRLGNGLDARNPKVAYVPGGGFFPYEGGENCMRLNFSYSDVETIQEGIKRLAKVTRREISLARALGHKVPGIPEEPSRGDR